MGGRIAIDASQAKWIEMVGVKFSGKTALVLSMLCKSQEFSLFPFSIDPLRIPSQARPVLISINPNSADWRDIEMLQSVIATGSANHPTTTYRFYRMPWQINVLASNPKLRWGLFLWDSQNIHIYLPPRLPTNMYCHLYQRMTKIVITGRRIKPDNDEYIVEAIKAGVDERK